MQEDTLWSNIFKKEHKKEANIYTVLHRIPIFQDLNKKELKAVDRILHRRTYKDEEIIFSESEPGVGMYIIENGKVNICIGKKKKLLALLSDGDFFGEMALLLESPRTATAIADGPLKMLGFFQPDFLGLLETHPRTGNKIMKRLSQMIAERLRQTNAENRVLKNKISEYNEKKKGK